MCGQLVPSRPPALPGNALAVKCQEHGSAAVPPTSRGICVVAVLLDALPEPTVHRVDPLQGGCMRLAICTIDHYHPVAAHPQSLTDP